MVSIGYFSKMELAAQLGRLAAFEPPVAGVQEEAADLVGRGLAPVRRDGPRSVRTVAPFMREAIRREQCPGVLVEHPPGVDEADGRLEYLDSARVADVECFGARHQRGFERIGTLVVRVRVAAEVD